MALMTLLPKSSNRQNLVVPLRKVTQAPFAPLLSLPVPGIERDIRVKLAATPHEWREAFQLVADNYQARGFDTENADFHFTSYHALPDTAVFVAQWAGRVVATFTLVPDNYLLGLPLESIYRAEVQQLRHTGRRLGEVTSLASTDLGLREFTQVFLTMIRLMKQYHLNQGGDTWVIAVNPRHSSYYTKLLGYAPLGPRRAYPKVQGHPAEAFYLDPKLMKASAPKMYERMFGTPLAPQVLMAPRLPEHCIRYFSRHSSLTREEVAQELLNYVADCGSPRRW